MKSSQKIHSSVLLEESIQGLNIRAGKTYVDVTFGRGGHSREILTQLGKSGNLIAIDRDLEAQAYAEEYFKDDANFHFLHGEMGQIKNLLSSQGIEKIDGLLMDIGVSSPQLDDAERGFSFMKDGPLDMRMDQSNVFSATEWVMTTDVDVMIDVFKRYGEERFSTRIARKIDERRQEETIDTTFKLVEIIREAIPFEDARKHPATRVFQAIRIAVNSELQQLESALSSSIDLLNKGGRLVAITFHSLEDRIVKNFMREHSEVKDLFPDLPILIEGSKPTLKLVGRAIRASDDEKSDNIRARSAILRIAERI